MADLYPVVVRVLKYEAGAWRIVHEFDPRSITRCECSFLGYRVEDKAVVEIGNFGSISNDGSPNYNQKVHAPAVDIQDRKGTLYRLDIHAGDTQFNADSLTYPTGWCDPPIYWSGILQTFDKGDPTKLTAVGWSAMLNRITVRDLYYYNTTLNGIANGIVNAISGEWPGDIELVTRSGGSGATLVARQLGWQNATARDALETLAGFSNFYFGVSVSGYPVMETESTKEFRLVFVEPYFETDQATPATGLAYGCNLFFDVQNNNKVVEYEVRDDDRMWANRWDISGESLHLDLFSIVTGHDGDEVRDKFSSRTGDTDTGVDNWEDGEFAGWNLVIVDEAVRQVDNDPTTGATYHAGRIKEVPSSLLQINSVAEYRILSYSESGGESIFTFGEFPAPDDDLNLSVNNTALRYTVRNPGGLAVLRVIRDEESTDASAGREEVVRKIEDGNVRGWLDAGLVAIQDRWAERFQSRSASLRVMNHTRMVNGSASGLDNLVRVGDGSGDSRLTRFGTDVNGGDFYRYGDDDRFVGLGVEMEIRSAKCVLAPAGWDVTYQLAAAPLDMAAITLPSSIKTRKRRRV